MIRNFTFDDFDKLGEAMDFVSGGAARLANRYDAADPTTSGVSPVVSTISPAGRSISTGRDLLRSQFPLGWSNR